MERKVSKCVEKMTFLSIPVRKKELWLFPRGQQNLPIEC